MALFDILKKSKKKEERPEKEVSKPVKERPIAKKEEISEPQKSARRVEKKEFSSAWRVLRSPHVTEKSTILAEQGKYVFKVNDSANKHEIKKAIEDLYGVAVDKVMVINLPEKKRRIGRSEGVKPGYKKAVVKLAAGEKIEIMPK